MGLFSRQKNPEGHPYADQLRARQSAGEDLTDDEKRTLAAIDGTNDYSIWDSVPRSQSAPVDENSLHCPNCKSINIQLLGQDRKAFSIGKAVAGGVLTGGVGVLAGFAGKKGNYQWVCMSCGNRFTMK